MKSFLDDLAVRRQVSASSQRQALNALVFLFREVLGRELGDFSDYEKARTKARLPVVGTLVPRFAFRVDPGPLTTDHGPMTNDR